MLLTEQNEINVVYLEAMCRSKISTKLSKWQFLFFFGEKKQVANLKQQKKQLAEFLSTKEFIV